MQMVYASPLMKAGEVRQACQDFREVEARIRRQNITVIPGGKR